MRPKYGSNANINKRINKMQFTKFGTELNTNKPDIHSYTKRRLYSAHKNAFNLGTFAHYIRKCPTTPK